MYISIIFSAIFAGMSMYFLCGRLPPRMIVKSFRDYFGLAGKKAQDLPYFKQLEVRLVKKGAAYHFGRRINATGFMVIKILFAAGAMVFGLMLGAIPAFVLMIFLFMLPDILLERMNRSDNEKMMPEIKLIFRQIIVRVKAGVYVTDALSECYFQLENERLKAGIYEFATDIAAKSDLRQALEDLSGKFDNGYMDFLCIAILQAFDTGKVVDLLKDTSEVIRDMEKSYLSSKKTSLDRKVTFYQLGLVAAILMVVIYGCIRNMYSMTAGI